MSQLTDRFEALTTPGPSAVALEDDRGALSFEALGLGARRIARGLVERSLGGCRIGLLTTQSADWVMGFFGIVLSGGSAVALSPLHPGRERAWFVESSSTSAILASDSLVASSDTSAVAVLSIEELAFGAREGSPLEPPSAGAGVAGGAHPGRPLDLRDAAEALLLFTSGTTGRPKAARLSHANVSALAELLGRAWGFSDRDCLLHTLPLHHLHGIGISLMVSLLAGARTIMLSRFDAEQVWEHLSAATVYMAVPTQHGRLFDAYDAADEPTRVRWRTSAERLRLVTSGSAALPVVLGDRWRALTGRYPLERYGMTEVGIALSNPLDGERRPGTVGRVLEGMEVRLVDEAGLDAAEGEPGEIHIKGPTVFLGYDGDPAGGEGALRDGWFPSGDTATWLPGGYVRILGRTSVDILKSGGYKLSALEIEEVLREHDAISDVAVVGLPDETWGEVCVAAIVPVLARREALAEPLLRAWAKERLAPYKVPRRVVLLPDLPRNPLGKVVKPELRRLLLAGAPEPDPTLAGPS